MNLNTPLETFFQLKEEKKKALKKLDLLTVRDLLYYYPIRYEGSSHFSYIKNLQAGESPTIYAEVTKITAKKAYRSKLTMTEAVLQESSGDKIKAVWFSQPYISKLLPKGSQAQFSGTVTERGGKLYLANPEFQKTSKIPTSKTGPLFFGEQEGGTLYPVYKTTRGISSKWLYYRIKKIFEAEVFENLKDPLPEEIRTKYKLPTIKTAFKFLHMPNKIEDSKVASKRFSFEEVFFIQLVKQKEKREYEKSGAFVINPPSSKIEKFTKTFSFSLTPDQRKSIEKILKDISSEKPMSRLLEGDVGSGKTAVAAVAAFAATSSRPKGQKFGSLQVAYMAPTEVLAKQIFSDFIEFFRDFNVSLGLLTSKDCQKFPSKTSPSPIKIPKASLIRKTLNGEIRILIGTHALISKNVFFENLGLVIIDEQHRFGKKQRARLRSKPQEKKIQQKTEKPSKITKKGLGENEDILPHLLSMTATPIPRTLALTVFGDLDLTVLKGLPAGRKKVQTEIVLEKDREKSYQKIRTELEKGHQGYVVCPRIEDPDPNRERTLNVRSTSSEQKRLQKEIFPEYKVGLLHSRLTKEEKESQMQKFVSGESHILVATSMIEVGINVPNATFIIIEGAERFGLSQLHQLRGRVMRSSHQPYCFLFAESRTVQTRKRLRAIKSAKDGFELAEYDLEFRGAGEMLGQKQWGISDLAMEAVRNIKMVEYAREEAREIIKKNRLKNYPETRAKFEKVQKEIYLE